MRSPKSIIAALALSCASVFCLPAHAAYSIVQFAHGSSAGAVPGHVVLGTAPTVGNEVWVMLHADTAPGTVPTIDTSSWVQVGSGQNTDTNFIGTFVLERTVQNGDTASLPNMATAGSVKYTYTAWEVAGGSGNLAVDLQVVGAVSYSASVSPLTFPSQTPQSGTTLALWSGANDFAASTVTVTSGWTADLNTGSEPNWGRVAAFHQANASAGTVINGSTPELVGGIGQIILQLTKPAYPYVRQSYSNQFNAHAGNYNTPGFLQTTPGVGNLELAFIEFVGNMPATGTVTVGGSWTKFDEVDHAGSIAAIALERYVQGGDTATLPQFFSTSSSQFFWGYSAYEIPGVAGTWAADFQSVKGGSVFSGTTVTTTTDTTLQPNTLSIVGIGTSGSGSATADTVGTGWAIDTSDGAMEAWGSSKTFASKSASVSNVITAAGSTNIIWEQVLIGPASNKCGGLLTVGVGC